MKTIVALAWIALLIDLMSQLRRAMDDLPMRRAIILAALLTIGAASPALAVRWQCILPRPELSEEPVWCGPEYDLHQSICALREVYGYVLTEEAMLAHAASDLNTPLAHYLMRRAAAIMQEEMRRVADPRVAPDLVP